MPLLGTKGAASAQGFGFTLASLGGPSWIGILTNTASDYGYGIAMAASGNIYISGTTVVSSVGKAYVAKYNNAGVLQWQRYLNNSTFASTAYSVNVDSSENVYLHGYFEGSSSTIYLGATKLNSSGTIQWSTKVGGGSGSQNYGYGGSITSDGAMYGAGSTVIVNLNPTIVYYTSGGSFSWQKVMRNDDYYTTGIATATDSSNNGYITCGTTAGNGFVSFNSSGTTLLNYQYNAIIFDVNYDNIHVDSSGNIYLAAHAAGQDGLVVLKLDSSGNVTWGRRVYSGSGNTYEGGGVTTDTSGNVYVCGAATVGGVKRGLINKYNSSGTLQWSNTLACATSVTLYSVTVSGTSLYVTGYTQRTNNDIIVAVLPTNGSKTGTYTVAGSSVTYAASGYTDASSAASRSAGVWSSIQNGSLTGSNSSFSAVSAGLTSSVTQL